jgi:hypothetical protein
MNVLDLNSINVTNSLDYILSTLSFKYYSQTECGDSEANEAFDAEFSPYENYSSS